MVTKKIIILCLLTVVLVISACVQQKTQLDMTTPTLTPIPTYTVVPSFPEEPELPAPTPTAEDAPTPTPYITLTPADYATASPTPVPTVNPQTDYDAVETIECPPEKFYMEVAGDHYYLIFEYTCQYFLLYANGKLIDTNGCIKVKEESGTEIYYEDFPTNELLDLRIELYDSENHLFKILKVYNLYVVHDTSFVGEMNIEISDISRLWDVETLIIGNQISGDIGELKGLANIKSLAIYHNETITGNINVVKSFTELNSFIVYSDYAISRLYGDIISFNECVKLRKLTLYGCSEIDGDKTDITNGAEVIVEKEYFEF